MSTSLLKQNMLENADPGTEVDASSYSELESLIDSYDVVLVGPQLGYRLGRIKKMAEEHNKVAAPIEPIAYGRCQGDVVLEQAKKLVEEK
jgi:PTS system cellobiose-specific IIB component